MDNFKNFAIVQVSTGYDAAATSIVLTSGHGAKCPTVPANAVWWNGTDYANPASDPNVEIVRMTARSTDTLTVTRGQESTSAATHNTGGKTYYMAFVVTALTQNKVVANDQANTYTTGVQDLSSATGFVIPVGSSQAPTAAGGLDYNSTDDAMAAGGHGALTGYIPRVLSIQIGSSDSITDDATSPNETAFATTFTLPANFLTAKRAVRVTCLVTINAGASPSTFQLGLRLGGIGGTLVYQSAASAPVASVQRGFCFQFLIVGTGAPGAAVNVYTQTPAATNWGAAGGVNNVNQPVAVATNASKAIALTAKWATNPAGTSTATLESMIVEELAAP